MAPRSRFAFLSRRPSTISGGRRLTFGTGAQSTRVLVRLGSGAGAGSGEAVTSG